MKVNSLQFLIPFNLVAGLAATPTLAATVCGLEFVSPQQLETLVAEKIGEPPNVNDPQYQTYFDEAASVAWAFTTQSNPAHPAVVCREIVSKGKDVVVNLVVRCGSTKQACDAMVATWENLNQRMIRELKGKKDKDATRQVNITSDSAKGWMPSEKLEESAVAAAEDYFSHIDSGRYTDAYAMMADVFRNKASEAQFVEQNQTLRQATGALLSRKLLKTTWTKDPTDGPSRGVFAAIDIASTYENVDRSCGYIVLYQPSDDDDFQIMRTEVNNLDNAMANAIIKKSGQKALDELWRQMSINCPT